jgi:hypothetical protein
MFLKEKEDQGLGLNSRRLMEMLITANTFPCLYVKRQAKCLNPLQVFTEGCILSAFTSDLSRYPKERSVDQKFSSVVEYHALA